MSSTTAHGIVGRPQVATATGEGDLVVMSIKEGALTEQQHLKLDADIACLDLSPLDEDSSSASLLAIGTWDMKVL